MKKLSIICMSALLMLAVSCKKNNNGVENAGSGFRTTVESHEGTDKTHLEGTAVRWNSGDAILVKSSTCDTPKRFTTTGGNDKAIFDAAENLPADFYSLNYTAFYPGFATNSVPTNPAGVSFLNNQLTLPSTQNYVKDSFDNGANPMAATAKSNVLPFKNICGVLKLQLYSATACSVSNITITSATSEKLYGTGTVTLDGNGIPSLGTLSSGGSTLKLNCNGTSLSTNASNPTIFYFVVPYGTLGTGFTVTLTDTDGKVWTKTAASASQNAIVRSQITKLPKQTVATKPIEPVDVLPGVFSVGADKKVQFSKGNLFCTNAGSSYTFAFEANQYDYRARPNDGTSGLFLWDINDKQGYGAFETSLSDGTTSGSDVLEWGEKIDGGSVWHTMTKAEWDYLYESRSGAANKRKTGVTVNGITGLVFAPDDFTGTLSASYTLAEWRDAEKEDKLVFLPNVGQLEYGSFTPDKFRYWTSTASGESYAYSVYVGGFFTTGFVRENGAAVRLVKYAN